MEEMHHSSVHTFVALLVLSVAFTSFSLGKVYCNCPSVEHVFIPRDDDDDDDSASAVFKSFL